MTTPMERTSTISKEKIFENGITRYLAFDK